MWGDSFWTIAAELKAAVERLKVAAEKLKVVAES